MSTLRNKVQLIGHVGNDPEIKTFDGGKKLAKLNVATNENYKNEKGEKV
jgi:single-strand DNA-binding protein